MKRVTSGNWLAADPIMSAFAGYDEADPMTFGERLVNDSESLSLSEKVPSEIVRLYEMARAAICYGYLFYPLYTLGFEQLSRCADAALQRRLSEVVPKIAKQPFYRRIEWSAKNGVIEPGAAPLWHHIRELRNAGAHSDGRTILPPSWAIGQLDTTVDLVNSLFEPQARRTPKSWSSPSVDEIKAAFGDS